MPRTINITVSDDNFDRLKQIKGDRSWEDALLQEFGIAEGNDQ